MSAFGLARQLNIPRKEAQKYMDLYFERYPGVLEYMERTRAQAKEQGYVETLDGRRLYLPDINPAMVLVVQRLNVQPLTRQCREPPPTLSNGR
ncbi:DNA polymerase I [Escherichia coli]|uniref:DNA-directed DNA polymerase n=1 Tax=Escherichia coli TaxID=562 RepID=A0A377B5S9_ECOLX|nr:DNA polymerase I [Escherichia coli]